MSIDANSQCDFYYVMWQQAVSEISETPFLLAEHFYSKSKV